MRHLVINHQTSIKHTRMLHRHYKPEKCGGKMLRVFLHAATEAKNSSGV